MEKKVKCACCGLEQPEWNKRSFYMLYSDYDGEQIYCLDCLGRRIVSSVKAKALNGERTGAAAHRINMIGIDDIVRLDKV